MGQLVASLVTPKRAARKPWWLWPNLLALDAPVVAVLWQNLLAEVLHIRIPTIEVVALALTCWLIYVLDYSSDAATAKPEYDLPARHAFFRRHRALLLILAAAVGCMLLVLSTSMSVETLHRGAWLALAVLAYLAFTHLGPSAWRTRWPRECGVAIVFAAGTSLSTWDAGVRCLVPTAVFAVLCWMNMAGIEFWESRIYTPSASREPSLSAEWLALHMGGCSVLILIALILLHVPLSLSICALASCIGLAGLGRRYETLSPDAVRVIADLVLCTPLVLLLVKAFA